MYVTEKNTIVVVVIDKTDGPRTYVQLRTVPKCVSKL